MADTVYSFRVRTIECDNCRAPLTGSLEGGQVKCSFCGASLQLGARPREHREQTRIGEPERLAGLGAQLEAYDAERALIRVPEGMDQFHAMLAAPATRAAGLEAFRQEWEKTRRLVGAGSGGAEGETRLLRLALLIAQTSREVGDHPRARAVLETALGHLSDGEQRDIVRCRLARAAVRAQDLEAAAAWLEEVNPRPIRLEADNEYRLARAALQLARGEHQAVLSLLGQRQGEAPLLHAIRPYALRAHALAALGETALAQKQIAAATVAWSRALVGWEWQACPGPSSALVGAVTARVRRGVTLSFVVFGLLVAGSCFGTCMTPFCIATTTCGEDGLYRIAIRKLRECPAAREALGEPIEWAVGPSSCEGEGNLGCKDGCGLPWTMRVKGSKARGRVTVESRVWNGERILITGDLHLGGRTIDFKRCQ